MIRNDHRYDVLIQVMQDILGEEIPREGRKAEWVWARTMAVYQMRQEGYTLCDIGKQMGRNHASVIHLLDKMQNALDYPVMYPDVMPIWFNFKVKLKNDI